MNSLRIALAQINPTVGALEHNASLILVRAAEAAQAGADLVVFPELTLSGYPPEDLVLKRHFIEDVEIQLNRIASKLPQRIVAVIGAPIHYEGRVYNAAVVVQAGRITSRYLKMTLPNYGVFDEKRVFAEGHDPLVITVKDAKVALHICEDSWSTDFPACQKLLNAKPDMIVNLSASPYHRGKWKSREEILGRTARFLNAPLLYCNLVGGQDELVFDGGSLALDAGGKILSRARSFDEDLLVAEVPIIGKKGDRNFQALETNSEAPSHPDVNGLADAGEVYEALCLGLKDYMNKNGFARAVIALSGGIDSALVATIAVDALGRDRVVGVTMPSKFSSEGTHSDAKDLADRLGIEFMDVPIKSIHELYLAELAPLWPGKTSDTTEENLQARIRGNIVMALSNKHGWLVLTTGNKSELATGYCTLYGDMAGGFAVIKDVPKTLVFALSKWRNEQSPSTPPIPETTITRPPSAELRPDQKDEDSLPPYAILDAIIERYVERDMSAERIVTEGFDSATVTRVISLIDGNEYKRRQGPPGIKITPKSFGRDRRLPITNLYSERVKPIRDRTHPHKARGVQAP
ncbi:MAG TPA: NAD+ synthase [Kiritimatiellia bacterium]|nr:NAD+ synthase [Kiritimatiellia bacterium]